VEGRPTKGSEGFEALDLERYLKTLSGLAFAKKRL
jgi:hypothetical protein